jgi:hypothetical protein
MGRGCFIGKGVIGGALDVMQFSLNRREVQRTANRNLQTFYRWGGGVVKFAPVQGSLLVQQALL